MRFKCSCVAMTIGLALPAPSLKAARAAISKAMAEESTGWKPPSFKCIQMRHPSACTNITKLLTTSGLCFFSHAIRSSQRTTRPQQQSLSLVAYFTSLSSEIGRRWMHRVVLYHCFILVGEYCLSLTIVKWRYKECRKSPNMGGKWRYCCTLWGASARVISGQCARGAPRRNEAEMARKEREWIKQVRKLGQFGWRSIWPRCLMRESEILMEEGIQNWVW